ncbi:MAG: hypothetical protein AB1631_29270 [Acidobacteriota bacterium]
MNHESKPIRMRAFRVVDREERKYFRCIVTEDVERAQFRYGSCSFGGAPPEEDSIPEAIRAEIDRSDAWNALQALREDARFPENDSDESAADSIDAAVSQGKMRLQGLMEMVFQGKIPISDPSEHEPTSKRSEPMAMAVPVLSSPSEDESQETQRMIDEVWDFAGGKRLEWKPVGNTPAGRKVEVLTFDGSEEVLVGPTSVEIPTRSE